jgi:hypothetical protein
MTAQEKSDILGKAGLAVTEAARGKDHGGPWMPLAVAIVHLRAARVQGKAKEAARLEAQLAQGLTQAAEGGHLREIVKASEILEQSRSRGRMRKAVLAAYIDMIAQSHLPTTDEIRAQMKVNMAAGCDYGDGICEHCASPVSIPEPRSMRAMLTACGLPFSAGKSGRKVAKRPRRKTRL